MNSLDGKWLDPWPFGLDRAPLVDFCNQGSPRAHPWNRPIFARPGTRACARRPRCRETVWPPPRSTEAELEQRPPPLRTNGAIISAGDDGGRPPMPPGPAGRPEVSRSIQPRRWLQPRFHGPGAGMLGCQQPLSTIRAQFPARFHPCGRPGGAATPTRSTRTPLVMRPLQCRLETPTLPDATGGNPQTAVGLCHGCDPTHPARGRVTPSRSHHASPTPAKGGDLRARNATCLDERAR